MLQSIPLPSLRPELSGMGYALVSKTESLIPFTVKKTLLEKGLNTAFSLPLEDDEFWFLEGRYLGLEITGAGIQVIISCRDNHLIVCDRDSADAWVKGEASDFLKLASRELDPDTLFFQRRLIIEGDTELGLGVKNLLDSLDWEDLPDSVNRLVSFLKRLPI